MLDGATTQVMIGGAPHNLAKPKLLLKLQSYLAFHTSTKPATAL